VRPDGERVPVPEGPNAPLVPSAPLLGRFKKALWGWLKKMWGFYVAHLPQALAVVLAVFVFLGLAHLVDRASGSSSSTAVTRPAEFVYLDPTRITSYLSQIEGKEIDDESLQEVTGKSLGGGVEVDSIGNVTASSSSQITRSFAVAQSEADKLDRLLKHLRQERSVRKEGSATKEGPSSEKAQSPEEASSPETEPLLKERNAKKCSFAKELTISKTPPGTMLLINNAVVRMPPYLSIYPELRYALYRRRLQQVFRAAPLYEFRAVDESVRGTPKLERERFLKTVGPDPRIPFTISAPYTNHEVARCKGELEHHEDGHPVAKPEVEVTVLLPARFALLTGDPSLLARPLTILGLVVSNSTGTFGDGLTVSTYWPAMSTAKAPLLRELGVAAPVLRMKRPELREALFNAMAETVTFHGHVVEVIPIAMYD
jgi:hypothetical protein